MPQSTARPIFWESFLADSYYIHATYCTIVGRCPDQPRLRHLNFICPRQETTTGIMNYKTLLCDQVLFEAFRKGEKYAFSKVYEAFKRVIYAFTIRMVRSAEAAEDLTVQTFVSLWEHRDTIESMAHLKNFLFVAARHGAINHLQANRRSQIELTTEVAEEIDTFNISQYKTDILFAELVQDILDLIETMPALRGKVFRMRFLEELSAKEVAEKLGISVHGVYWHTKEAVTQAREAVVRRAQPHSNVLFFFLLLAPFSLIRDIF